MFWQYIYNSFYIQTWSFSAAPVYELFCCVIYGFQTSQSPSSCLPTLSMYLRLFLFAFLFCLFSWALSTLSSAVGGSREFFRENIELKFGDSSTYAGGAENIQPLNAIKDLRVLCWGVIWKYFISAIP